MNHIEEFKNYQELQKLRILNSFNLDSLEKGGEGSRGGRIIGHTKSGKPIYASKSADHPDNKNFTEDDHLDAVGIHFGEHAKRGNSMRNFTSADKSDEKAMSHFNKLSKEKQEYYIQNKALDHKDLSESHSTKSKDSGLDSDWKKHGGRDVDGQNWMVDTTRNIVHANIDGKHTTISGSLKDGYRVYHEPTPGSKVVDLGIHVKGKDKQSAISEAVDQVHKHFKIGKYKD